MPPWQNRFKRTLLHLGRHDEDLERFVELVERAFDIAGIPISEEAERVVALGVMTNAYVEIVEDFLSKPIPDREDVRELVRITDEPEGVA